MVSISFSMRSRPSARLLRLCPVDLGGFPGEILRPQLIVFLLEACVFQFGIEPLKIDLRRLGIPRLTVYPVQSPIHGPCRR